MRQLTLRFWVLAALVLLVNVLGLLLIRQEMLSRRDKLRVLSFAPLREVDEADRVTLLFDEPVARAHMIGADLDHSPFEIEPRLPGRWQWQQADQLVYLLDKKLPAGREWTIKPAANFETQVGRQLVGEAQFTLRTRALKWLNAEVIAFDREFATIAIQFNQSVRPDEVLQCLSVFDPSRSPQSVKLPVQGLGREPAERVMLRVGRPRSSDRIRLHISPELKGDGGKLPLGLTDSRDLQIPTVFQLANATVETPGEDTEVSVQLRFTKLLDTTEHGLDKIITVTPPVANLTSFVSKDSWIGLNGRFEIGRRYTATVAAELRDREGKTLGSPQTVSFEIPDREPSLSIPASRGILTPGGNLALDLRTANVESVKLAAWKLHANNLVPHLRGEDVRATSRRLVERDFKLHAKRNEPHVAAIDLRQLFDKAAAAPGVYHIEARAEKPHWLEDDAVITITDLAITAKRQAGGYFVWVTSLKTGKPVEGAQLTALTHSNQLLAAAVTDTHGVAHLKAASNHPDGETWLITAEHGDDLTYHAVDRRQWVIDHVDQSGRNHPETYDAMLYPERGVYNPGDTIHVTAIVREQDGLVPLPMRLSMRVTRPDGKQVAEIAVPADKTGQGVFHVDFPTSSDGQFGQYTFSLGLPGSKDSFGETTALVEAFTPVRLDVKALPTQSRYRGDEKPTISVDANYLFGQPAAQLPVALAPSLQMIPYESKQFKDYSFNTGRRSRRVPAPGVEASLDDRGNASLAFAVPESEEPAVWRASVATTVSEMGGRSVSQNSTLVIDTRDRHLGLRPPARGVVQTRTPLEFEWCLVNGIDETQEPGSMRVQLLRIEHDWVIQQVDGRAVWKSVERQIAVRDEDFKDTAARRFSVTCPVAGPHRLILSESADEDSPQVVAQYEFEAVDDVTQYSGPAVSLPERVELVLDQKTYKPGDTATLVVRSPFAGTLLATVETNRVTQSFVVPMTQNTATLQVPVPSDLRGGAFISASVVRAIDPSQDKWLPHRAVGMVRLRTDHSDSAVPLAITAPSQAEPGESITIEVTGEEPVNPDNPAVAHIWAVDDGILLTTGFRTPSPLDHFFAPRKLDVTTGDVFADLLPDHKRAASMQRIGAGGDDEFELRRSPVAVKQREPAILWRTVVPVGADGRAVVDMPMPRLTGRMRIMAVYVDHDRYGSAKHDITVTSPLLVEASWPRFAAPDDTFEVPVKLFNAAKEPLTVRLASTVDGPLEIENAAAPIIVQPGEPQLVWLKARAISIGQISATLNASANAPSLGRDLVASTDVKLTIRPITPLHVESQLVRVKAGESLDVKLPDMLEQAGARIAVTISGDPVVELRPAIEQLLDYPYGCVEQTTSRLLGVLHAPELLELDGSQDQRAAFSKSVIEAGIARLWSMQTRDGGLSYWPGDHQADLFGTLYAADFLVRAKRAGYRLDREFIGEMTRYLSESMDASQSELDPNMRAQVCHALASLGRAPQGWVARLTERVDALDMAGRAHLAAAWMEMGRKDRALSVLPDDTVGLKIPTSSSARLTTQVRQEAVLLSVLLELQSDHAWIPLLVRRLEDSRRRGSWGTTIENASALCALSKYQLRSKQPSAFTGTVQVDGESKLLFASDRVAALKVNDTLKPIRVLTEGRGEAFVSVTSTGLLKVDQIKPYDHNLQVRRRWLTREGKVVDHSRLRVGDLVQVEIQVAAPTLPDGESIENLAIVDALPGACEIEHPRLLTSAKADSTGPVEGQANRIEFHHDRVIIFAAASREIRVFRYALRVTTQGTFALPPAQASCMYDPAIASMTEQGKVTARQ